MLSLTSFELICIGLGILGGGVLRGMSGFGFSLTMIIVLTLFMSPLEATSYVVLWEVLASIIHLPFVWRHVDWKSLKFLCVGVLFGTPLGIMLLVYIPATPMAVAINVTVIIMTLIMLSGVKLTRSLNNTEVTATGFVSGLINGASANGGPPVILLFFSSPAGVNVGRASIIAYFLFTDIWASAIFIQQGVMSFNTLWACLAFIPLLAFGMWLGTKLYGIFDEKKFLYVAMSLLLTMSCISIFRALI